MFQDFIKGVIKRGDLKKSKLKIVFKLTDDSSCQNDKCHNVMSAIFGFNAILDS
jgi:hypothetical protein